MALIFCERFAASNVRRRFVNVVEDRGGLWRLVVVERPVTIHVMVTDPVSRGFAAGNLQWNEQSD